MQPPGLNLAAGAILKAFPVGYPAVFQAIYLIMGALIALAVYRLCVLLRVSAWLSLGLTVVFVVSPGVVLFENWLVYEYPILLLLLGAAICLYHFARTGALRWSFAFFGCLLALLMLRNTFHPAYLVLVTGILFWLMKGHRRAVVYGSCGPLALTFALSLKNWLLVGVFSSSTWLGMNLGVVTTFQLTPTEADSLIRAGVVSPVARITPFSSLDEYRPYLRKPVPHTGIPVLDQERTSTGHANYNNPAYIEVGEIYAKDAKALLLRYPRVYWRSVSKAWFTYFLPASDSPFFERNRVKIRGIERVYNAVLFGEWRQGASRKELRRMEGSGATAGLVLYTGVFLLIGLPLVWIWSTVWLISGVRSGRLDRPLGILVGFLIFNIAYVTLVSNTLSTFEGNRYRFPLDGYYVALCGLMLERMFAALRSRKARAETQLAR
jgi:hypothetical protein